MVGQFLVSVGMVTLGLIEAVGSVLPWRQRPQTVYECRQCGTTLDDAVEACPNCGSDGIAQFVIE